MLFYAARSFFINDFDSQAFQFNRTIAADPYQ